MYDTKDISAAVRTVQGYLYYLHRVFPERYLRVYTDGVYGNETRKAVENFQTLSGIVATGKVDLVTFERLYSEYLSAKTSMKESEFGFPMKIGDLGRGVEELHLLLRELGEYYTELPRVMRSAYYSEQTRDAVNYMRGVFNLESTGEVDIILFERLKGEINARRRISN